MAVEGERKLGGSPSDRATGTSLLVDALSLGLELAHGGTLAGSAVGTSLVSAVTAQIERRWVDLDQGSLRLGLGALRPAESLDPSALLEEIPLWSR